MPTLPATPLEQDTNFGPLGSRPPIPKEGDVFVDTDTGDTYYCTADGTWGFAGGKGVITNSGIEFSDATTGNRILWNANTPIEARVGGYSAADTALLRLDTVCDNTATDYVATQQAATNGGTDPYLFIELGKDGTAATIKFSTAGDGDVIVSQNSTACYLPLTVYKSTIETVNDSAVLQNENTLTIPVLTNGKYAFEYFILFNSNTTADFQWAWSVPASCTMNYITIRPGTVSGSATDVDTDETSTIVTRGTGADISMSMKGVIINGANAGTVTPQWAQNTQNASDTSVLPGSWVRYQRLA